MIRTNALGCLLSCTLYLTYLHGCNCSGSQTVCIQCNLPLQITYINVQLFLIRITCIEDRRLNEQRQNCADINYPTRQYDLSDEELLVIGNFRISSKYWVVVRTWIFFWFPSKSFVHSPKFLFLSFFPYSKNSGKALWIKALTASSIHDCLLQRIKIMDR